MIEFLIGFFTGVAASMGLGGGFVLLIFMINFTDISQRQAQGTNILFFLPIALLSIIFHTKNKLIEWSVVLKCIFWGIIGVVAGYLIAWFIDEKWLSYIFAGLMAVVGVKELFHKNLDNTNKNNRIKTLYFQQYYN
ncbi:MAG: sulfite exporter TauE/SafE family protein [Clostridiales bacterium]|nr:sulfite exporter TauE/SafE family protein [Clostridiales bacterium]